MKTKAVVFAQRDHVELRDLDVPPPSEQEIQVQSAYSTISVGTERWILTDRFTWMPTQFPCVPGYQRSGTVTAIGSGVSGWRVGDRALALTGTWSDLAVARAFGGHIAVANVPVEFAYAIPQGVTDLGASAAVVAQVGYNAAHRATVRAGDWVICFGDGLIGQFAAQAARARGARVALVGHHAERLQLALQYSADAVVDSMRAEVVPAVREIVRKDYVAIVLDSVQSLASMAQYIDLLEKGCGEIVYNGFNPGSHWADMGVLQQRELTAHFVSGWTRERIEATLELMAAQRIRAEPLVTHVVSYTQAAEIYQSILRKDQAFLGVALDWRPGGS
jgi:2-desacetyl-2-hydroxyethyl bacteriochlorophyllide A dehydrogenase